MNSVDILKESHNIIDFYENKMGVKPKFVTIETGLFEKLLDDFGALLTKRFENDFLYGYSDKKEKAPLTPHHVLVNGDVTTVVWEDGTHTIVKRAEDDEPDQEKAILYAILKKAADNDISAVKRYLDIFEEKTVVKGLKSKKQKDIFAYEWMVQELKETEDGISVTAVKKTNPTSKDLTDAISYAASEAVRKNYLFKEGTPNE